VFFLRFSLAARILSVVAALPLPFWAELPFGAINSLEFTAGQNSSTNQSAGAMLESRTGGCGFLISVEKQSVGIQDVADDD
jgi:hypothetical protein